MNNKLCLILAIIVMIIETGFGQASRPFPQNVDYSFGVKPKTIMYEDALKTYNKWKKRYLVSCNINYRVKCEGGDETRVEAIGFGMILTAYFGDKNEFDGLYDFYLSKLNAKNMMAWNVSCEGINDPGSATDGDIDVAFSLVVAYNQWGGDYLEKAKDVIQAIKNAVITTCNNLLVVAPGYSVESDVGTMWGGCDLTDIQYYTPAFFRIFAEVSGDNDWNKLADDTYTILNAAAHPETGLVPDWQSVNGTPGGNSNRIPFFSYDACRVPWRMSLDYLWNGNEQARCWCAKVSDWAYKIGPAEIRDGYNLDGTKNNLDHHNSAFVGGFAVAAMCNNQEVADAFGTEMTSRKLRDRHWFSMSTRSLYLLPITGNFWKPSVPSEMINK